MRVVRAASALAALAAPPAGAQPAPAADTASASRVAPLITNVAGRRTTTLNGRWSTIVDPFETGYYTYRRRPDPNGYFRNRKPADPAELVEYDFDRSPQLAVPGDWNTQREDLRWYEGTVWYKTSFARTLAPGRRLFVHFGAANYEARVWLNGTELGVHEGGFTPFDFEVTRLVRPGANDLVVKVDNRRRPEAIPTVNSDWWNYGGLTRDVSLVETPATFVRDYVLQLDPAHPDRARGWVQLDGPAPQATPVTVRVPGARLAQTVTPNASGWAALALDARRLTRWSTGRPTLYDVEVATAAETVRDRIGFRTIAARGTEILLNGRPIFLRGIAVHEEAPYEARRAYSRDDARVLLGWVHELGGNFVRLAHYPHNEAMLRAADELGVLVWAEIPVYWTIDWRNPATLASAEQQLGEGWYDGTPEKADSVRWTSAFAKPLVMSEFGGDARQGLHGPAGARWTEEYQARLYEHQAAMLRRIPFLAGTTPWILKDFRSPRRPLPGIQDYFNRKGLVSERGERKQAFGVLQRFYTERRAARPDPAP